MAGNKHGDDSAISSFETQFIEAAAGCLGIFHENIARFVENGGHSSEVLRRWFGANAHRLAQYADARTLQAVFVEELLVTAGDMAYAQGGQRVLRIIADQHIQ